MDMGFLNKNFFYSFLKVFFAFSLLFVFSCSEDNGGAAKHTLTITKPTGGVITSNVGSINCDGEDNDNTCKTQFSEGSEVTLTAKVNAEGHTLGDWGGDCRDASSSNTCKLIMNEDKNVGLKFFASPASPELTALAGNAQVSLSWRQGDDGGSDITKYQYRVSADRGMSWNPDWMDISNSAPGETNAMSFTVMGLVNRKTYTFEIRAVNLVGNGTSSQVSAAPATVPGALKMLRALGRYESVRLFWEPGDDGGSDITKYQYRVSADGGMSWNPDWTDIKSPGSGINVKNFDSYPYMNGKTYTFEIRAVNLVGNGASSRISATPKRSTIPDPPEGFTARAGNAYAQVALSWTLGDDGGSNITKHQYRVSPDGGVNWNPDWTDIPSSTFGEIHATSFTVAGLTNETEYTFEIRAVNSRGDGTSSQASTTSKGPAAPDMPDDFIAFADNTQVLLSWGQVDDGESDITKYQYRVSPDGGMSWNPDWTNISSSTPGGANAESFTIMSLNNSREYTFEICAVNDFDEDGMDDAGPASQATATPTSTSMAVLPKTAEAHIDTKGETIVDEPKIAATLRLLDEDGSSIFQEHISVEYRGSSSQWFPKKSYGFETWDKDGNDIDVALAGFPEEEDWIFYAPYSDKSLIRNVLMYELSNDIGRYASKTKFFDLYINGDFLGCYVLMEKPKRDKNRINVSNKGFVLKLDKTTGGGGSGSSAHRSFLSKYSENGERLADDVPHYLWKPRIPFLFDYPDPDEITSEQIKSIRKYMGNFEEALFGNDFKDATHGYRKWIDTASFTDYFLLNEFSRDVDAFKFSTYIHKEEGGKLKMGPIWDFNLALGNANYCSGDNPEGWAHLHPKGCNFNFPGTAVPHWWERLLEDLNWVRELEARWTSLRSSTFATAAIHKKIDDKIRFLKERRIPSRNFKKWSILRIYVWPNSFIGKNYAEEIDSLKDWTSKRLTWMDGAINSL